MLVAPAPVDVVVLDEHGGRQYDIREFGSLCQELLVHRDKQVIALKPCNDVSLLRRDIHGIGILNEQCMNRRAVAQRFCITGQNPTDLRLIERSDIGVNKRLTFYQTVVYAEYVAIGMKPTASLDLPGTRHCRNAECGMHRNGTVATARKAVAQAEIGRFCLSHQTRKGLDLIDR